MKNIYDNCLFVLIFFLCKTLLFCFIFRKINKIIETRIIHEFRVIEFNQFEKSEISLGLVRPTDQARSDQGTRQSTAL